MRLRPAAALLVLCVWRATAFAQCAPAPDSAYFFRDLTEQRADAKIHSDRSFFEQLLSDSFGFHARSGQRVPKEIFIDSELASNGAGRAQRFYSVRHFTLLEH